MEQLDKIHELSIAELRKILSDNDIKETTIEDKSELIELVGNTLLSAMMIDQLEKESETEYTESLEVSKSIEASRKSKEQCERKIVLDEQEQEYEEAVRQDSKEFEELSPRSLRDKRLQFLDKIVMS